MSAFSIEVVEKRWLKEQSDAALFNKRDAVITQELLKFKKMRGQATTGDNDCLLDCFWQAIQRVLSDLNLICTLEQFCAWMKQGLGVPRDARLSINDPQEGAAILAQIRQFGLLHYQLCLNFELEVLLADYDGSIGTIDTTKLTAVHAATIVENKGKTPVDIPCSIIYVHYNHYEPVLDEEEQEELKSALADIDAAIKDAAEVIQKQQQLLATLGSGSKRAETARAVLSQIEEQIARLEAERASLVQPAAASGILNTMIGGATGSGVLSPPAASSSYYVYPKDPLHRVHFESYAYVPRSQRAMDYTHDHIQSIDMLIPQKRDKDWTTFPLPDQELEPLRPFDDGDRCEFDLLNKSNPDWLDPKVQRPAFDAFAERAKHYRLPVYKPMPSGANPKKWSKQRSPAEKKQEAAIDDAVKLARTRFIDFDHDMSRTRCVIDYDKFQFKPDSFSPYCLYKQTNQYVKMHFPCVLSQADVRIDPERRALRIDGVFFTLNGAVEPLEWRDAVVHRQYGVVRLPGLLGLDVYLRKAIPSYWAGGLHGGHSREQRAALHLHLQCFPLNDEEKGLMTTFCQSLAQLFTLVRTSDTNTHIGSVTLTCSIAESLLELNSRATQRREEPVDVLVLLGHGTKDGNAIALRSTEIVTAAHLQELVSITNSVVDANVAAGLPQFVWSSSGLKLIMFLNCGNGIEGGMASQLAKLYPVPTISFSYAIPTADLSDSNSYALWFLYFYCGWRLGQSLALNTTFAAKEFAGLHDELDVAHRLATYIRMQPTKDVPVIRNDLDLTKLHNRLFAITKHQLGSEKIKRETFLEQTAGAKLAYCPSLRRGEGFNDARYISHETILRLGKDNIRQLVNGGILHPVWVAVEEIRKQDVAGAQPTLMFRGVRQAAQVMQRQGAQIMQRQSAPILTPAAASSARAASTVSMQHTRQGPPIGASNMVHTFTSSSMWEMPSEQAAIPSLSNSESSQTDILQLLQRREQQHAADREADAKQHQQERKEDRATANIQMALVVVGTTAGVVGTAAAIKSLSSSSKEQQQPPSPIHVDVVVPPATAMPFSSIGPTQVNININIGGAQATPVDGAVINVDKPSK